ncbi:MAG: hypothetical protein JWO58_2379 [Chitinophagaceae bacterium]|nr:hypothetical protein [Chitinophagaceae bacterium]
MKSTQTITILKRSLCCWCIVSLVSKVAFAHLSVVPKDTTVTHKSYTHFRPFPVAIYLPETQVALGALGVLLFKAGNDSMTRTSNIDFAAIYTMRNQLIIDPMFSVFTKKEKYFLKGGALFMRFPEFYYGVGNGTSPNGKENITFDALKINLRVLRKIKTNLFLGGQYQYFDTYNVKYSNNSSFVYQNIDGRFGSITSGFGPAMVYDSRNSILTPTSGHYLEISNFIFNRTFGSQFNFSNVIFDYRRYLKINNRGIVAIQYFANINIGHVPLNQLAMVGGNSVMRGYYNGRFRDKDMFVIQTELRQHLFWRIGYTLFADVGNVTDHFATPTFKRVIYTAGVGLRYQIVKAENLNLRLDFGVGKHTRGFYFTLSEAF